MISEKKENRDALNAYFREYYKNNKESHLLAVKKWKANNPLKFKAYQESLRTPEKMEKRRLYLAKWRTNNRKKIQGYDKKRRADIKAARESLALDQSS